MAKDAELLDLLTRLKRLEPHAGGNEWERTRDLVGIRLTELQDETTQALVRSTDQLGRTTKHLVFATWGLGGATLALVIAEVILKVWLGK